jgi:hypothetical protein
MTQETDIFSGDSGQEVAESAALMLFVGSGISAVLFFCVSAGGGAPLAALLGVVAVGGLTASVFFLHRLSRNTVGGRRQH